MNQHEAIEALQAEVVRRTRDKGWWVTPILTACVVDWMRVLGAADVRTEAPVAYQWRGRRLSGRVDVLGLWPSGRRLAVEIDRTSKPQSLMKLRALRNDGCRVLWLRWNEGNHHAAPHLPDVPCAWLSIANPQSLDAYLARDEWRKSARRRKHAAK